MLIRTAGICALGLAVASFGVSSVSAQGPGPDLKKLEAQVSELKAHLKMMEDMLARAKEGSGKAIEGKKKGFEKGPPGFDKKGGPPGFERKGFGPGAGKESAEAIKEKYEHYKKLYDESKRETARPGGPPFGKGPGGWGGGWMMREPPALPSAARGRGPDGGSRSVEARIDRLILELEELRREVRRK